MGNWSYFTLLITGSLRPSCRVGWFVPIAFFYGSRSCLFSSTFFWFPQDLPTSGGLDDWVGCYIYTYVIYIYCLYIWSTPPKIYLYQFWIVFAYTKAFMLIYVNMCRRWVIYTSPPFRNFFGNQPPSYQYLVYLDSRYQIYRQVLLLVDAINMSMIRMTSLSLMRQPEI